MNGFEIHFFASVCRFRPIEPFHHEVCLVNTKKLLRVDFKTVKLWPKLFEESLRGFETILKAAKRKPSHDVKLEVIG